MAYIVTVENNNISIAISGTGPQGATGATGLWSPENDGEGSGLDADLLDGQHGSFYAPVSHVGTGSGAHATAVANAAAGFMSASDKAKLDGIADSANNYTHPSSHTPGVIAQDASNRFVTDDEKIAWNSKAAGSHGHSISHVTGLQNALDSKIGPAELSSAVSALVDASPGTLDTLNELAAALGDDPNFATTVTNSLAAKANSASLGTMAVQSANAVNIDGGTIDGTVIGGTTPAAGSFTTLSAAGDIATTNSGAIKVGSGDNTCFYAIQNSGSSDNATLSFVQVGVAERGLFDATGLLKLHNGLSVTGGISATSVDGYSNLKLTSPSATLRSRYIDATVGIAIEASNAAESTYIPLALTGNIIRLHTGAGGLSATLDAAGNLAVTGALSASNYSSAGTNPAASGVYRLPNAQAIRWRNVANSADGFYVMQNASNNLGIYNASNTLIVEASDTGLSVTGALRASGDGMFGTAGPYSANDRLSVQKASDDRNGIAISNQYNGAGASAKLTLGAYGNDWFIECGSYLRNGNSLTFGTTSGTKATLDAAGNLGLSVTPSGWSAGAKAIEIGESSSVSNIGTTTGITVGANVYYSSGWKYRLSSESSTLYEQFNGTHKWSTAPSGTAGNPITFTQAMMLDAAGNLIVGGTAASDYGATTINPDGGITSIFTSGVGGNIYLGAVGGVGNGYQISVATNNASTYKWFNAGTQAMTLDASGNLLLNQTAVGQQNSNSHSIEPGYIRSCHINGSADGFPYATYSYNNGIIGSITQSGTTAVSYNTTSDPRLKTNVRPANASRFNDIEFVDFEWIDGRHDCGVLAPQLQSVYPDLVTGNPGAVEIRQVEITPAIPAVTEKVLVSEAVFNGDGEEIEPAIYETVEIAPAVEATYEDQTFPVYQQVNYMGLIGRMGVRIQIQDKQLTAQAELLAKMEARLALLEARLALLEAA